MPQNQTKTFALFNLGFRPFFLVAALFSVISIFVWMLVYSSVIQMPNKSIASFQWHAHEMIYGYSLAVIAGFLLTASKSWTGLQTLNGYPLLLLVCLWIMPRFLLYFDQLIYAAIFDLFFNFGLAFAVLYPIYKVRQWRQKGVVAILFLFSISNIIFYLGVFDKLTNGVTIGIYLGLYLILAMVFIMSARVVPTFIQNGVDYDIKLTQYQWVNLLSLPLLIAFVLMALLLPNHAITAYLGLTLFILMTIRLFGWHTIGIWQKSLLWSLYLSLCLICIGFLLMFCSYVFGISKYLAIHAFGYGGIGGITLAMMARVAYGHTGRNLKKPPIAIGYAFALIFLGAITRVMLPLFFPQYYLNWVIASQILWILAFLLFIIVYLPILVKPRVDEKFG